MELQNGAFDFHGFYHTCSKIYVLYIPVYTWKLIFVINQIEIVKTTKICNPRKFLALQYFESSAVKRAHDLCSLIDYSFEMIN